MRLQTMIAAFAACALAAAGCSSTTTPEVSAGYTATILLQETGSYETGALVVSPHLAVSGYIVDSTQTVGGYPAGVLAGTLTVQEGSAGPPQVIGISRAPVPHYAGTFTATNDSTLRIAVSGDTLDGGTLAVRIAGFSVDLSGPPMVPRIAEPLPEAQLTPVSGLTVRWSDLPSTEAVEASVTSTSTPAVTVTARGVTDLGFLTFSKSQIASLPEGPATLSVTRSRVKRLSVSGLAGGTATLAATVTMPVSIVAPIAPHHDDGTR